MFDPDRPAWLRVATTAAYFGILGPLVGIVVVLTPLVLLLPFAGFAALMVLQKIFLLVYLPYVMPAAITGACAALVSPVMRAPAWVSFYVSTFVVGGAATFVCIVLLGAATKPSDAASLFWLAWVGAISAIICAGLARRWPLGRVQ